MRAHRRAIQSTEPFTHSVWAALPAVFYTTTFVSFVIYALTRDPFFWDVALRLNLIGVATAVVALVPLGLDHLDHKHADNDSSRTRTLSRAHLWLHGAAIITFAIQLVLQHDHLHLGRATRQALTFGEPVVLPGVLAPLVIAAVGFTWMAVGTCIGLSLALRRETARRRAPRTRALRSMRT